MSKTKKISLGIRTSTKMFRLKNLVGIIVDDLMEQISSNRYLSSDYYSSYVESSELLPLTMKSPDGSNVIQFELDQIIFTKTTYDKSSPLNTEKTFKEFAEVFNIIDKHLKIKNVRRIGIVGEYRFKQEKASLNILEKLTRIPADENIGRFNLRFNSQRKTDGTGEIKNIDVDDYFQKIVEVYDSSLDRDYPELNHINFNIDFQHYHNPTLTRNIWDRVKAHKRMFDEESKVFLQDFRGLGFQAE